MDAEKDSAPLDDDTGPPPRKWLTISLIVIGVGLLSTVWGSVPPSSHTVSGAAAIDIEVSVAASAPVHNASSLGVGDRVNDPQTTWRQFLPVPVLLAVGVLILLSAFFSGSETAFFSIHKLQLRTMRKEKTRTGRLVASVMEHPARLLTTILVGNMIVNTLIGVLLGTRMEELFYHHLHAPNALAYVAAVALCTSVLVLFGEITPKVFAVRIRVTFARYAVIPLTAADKILSPLRDGALRITDFLFRVTRFHQLHAAPFITDEELKSALSKGEVQGVIEQDERQMIQGILEFSDALLREILVPRTEVVAISESATAADALALLREHEFSRMPMYAEDLDHITGVLVMKDVLPDFARGNLDRPIKTLARPAHFVPETMTIRQFVKQAQRHRAHLAIVVDEYGGTAGIVTLEDAIEEVVGEIVDENEKTTLPYERLGRGEYRVVGTLPLDELSELIGVALIDKEHETVAGFLMNQIDRIPKTGDQIKHSGVVFTVEACEGKRVSSVRVCIPPPAEQPSEEEQHS